jgi:hypothetical protein
MKKVVFCSHSDVSNTSNNVLSTQFTQDKAGNIGESQLFEVTSLFLLPRRLFTQNSDK